MIEARLEALEVVAGKILSSIQSQQKNEPESRAKWVESALAVSERRRKDVVRLDKIRSRTLDLVYMIQHDEVVYRLVKDSQEWKFLIGELDSNH